MPEHYSNITVGFEGGEGGRGSSQPPSADVSATTCFELIVAHINTAGGEVLENPYGRPYYSETDEWSTVNGDGSNVLMYAGKVGLPGGRIIAPRPGNSTVHDGNILKMCVCFPLNWFGNPGQGPVGLPTILTYLGMPNGGGAWHSLNNIMTQVLKIDWILAKIEEMGFPASPDPFPDEWKKPHTDTRTRKPMMAHASQYVYVAYKKVCGPPCMTAGCECNDQLSIKVDVNEKTKEYTASDGTKIKIKMPGNREKVIEQIVEAESKIKLKCATKAQSDY